MSHYPNVSSCPRAADLGGQLATNVGVPLAVAATADVSPTVAQLPSARA
jgi:hypothetical protein